MNLESARTLKGELASFLVLQMGTRGAGDGTIGLGFAPSGSNDYDIAVRAPSEDDLSPRLRHELTQRADDRGAKVDIRYTGNIGPGRPGPMAGTRRIGIGASVGHYLGATGTLGFFARRTADGALGIVSNNHVLAACDQGRESDAILNPGRADGGNPTGDVIAHLSGPYPPLLGGTGNVDCAFACLAGELQYDPAELTPDWRLAPGTAEEDEHDVAKVGRTTGFTQGRITAVELDNVWVRYGIGSSLRFKGQIEIDSLDSTPFSQPGDSGSLLFSRQSSRCVGLVYACSAAGGEHGCGLTYAHPIDSVLKALGVTFLT